LLLGLLAGTVAGLFAVAPHLVGAGADVLRWRLVLLLLGVLAVGFGTALVAVLTTLRAPLLTALRRE
jgi:hypothetical protein